MQIGEVAARVGLSLRTLRHWDEVGLVVPSERSAGRFRLYTESDIERLELVKSLKPLEFSLDQMRDLLATIDAIEAAGPANTGTSAAASAESNPEEQTELGRRLGTYRAAAEARTEALRAQIQGLETLTRTLRRLEASTKHR